MEVPAVSAREGVRWGGAGEKREVRGVGGKEPMLMEPKPEPMEPEVSAPTVTREFWPAYEEEISMASAVTEMRLVVPTALNVLPLLVRPSPAVVSAEPENCVKVREDVSSVMGLGVMSDQPVLAYAVPSVTKAYMPDTTSEFWSASVERLHAPAATP